MGCLNSKPAEAEPTKTAVKVKESKETPDELALQQLHSAVRWNKVDEVSAMLTKDNDDELAKATANKKDPKNGNTALHIAAQNGHFDMCKMLVANGADVDAQNAGGNTPLHMVTSYDIDDVKAYLDEQGANGTVKNQEGFQARYGLSGEKDPTSVAFAVETFRSSSDEKSLLNALDTLKKKKGEMDKATFPGIGLKVKKANKESGAWSEKVQKKFTELVQSLE